MKNNKAVVPIINSKDTIKYKTQNRIFNLNRNNLLLTQTPQAFRFNELYNFAINEKNKINEPNLLNYLDLVALGTICDVVPLTNESSTRIIFLFSIVV